MFAKKCLKQYAILTVVFGFVLFCFVGIVNATIIIYEGLEGGSGDVQSVGYNDYPNQVGLTIFGTLMHSGDIVQFTGNEYLSTSSSGQARIEAVDGAFNYLEIIMAEFPNKGWDKIQFNIDAAGDGDVELTFTDNFDNAFSGVFELDGRGQNFFTAIAFDDQVMMSATINSLNGQIITAIGDVQQIRINPLDFDGGNGGNDGNGGNGGYGTEPVPEPATMLLFGTGLAGLVATRYRRKEK